jgi:hypothetical protein
LKSSTFENSKNRAALPNAAGMYMGAFIKIKSAENIEKIPTSLNIFGRILKS